MEWTDAEWTTNAQLAYTRTRVMNFECLSDHKRFTETTVLRGSGDDSLRNAWSYRVWRIGLGKFCFYSSNSWSEIFADLCKIWISNLKSRWEIKLIYWNMFWKYVLYIRDSDISWVIYLFIYLLFENMYKKYVSIRLRILD